MKAALLTKGMMLFGAADVWGNIKTFFSKTGTNLTGISWGIFLAACVVAGISFAFGNDGSRFGKSLLSKVLIGVLVVSLASAIISTAASMSGTNANF